MLVSVHTLQELAHDLKGERITSLRLLVQGGTHLGRSSEEDLVYIVVIHCGRTA